MGSKSRKILLKPQHSVKRECAKIKDSNQIGGLDVLVSEMKTAYQAAKGGTVLVNLNQRGRIALTGRDQAALIHRMSTNDLERLKPGQGAMTVLTTPVGRIIDVLLFLRDEEQSIVLTSKGRGDAMRRYFQRNIFFNDQVQQRSIDAETALYGVFGAEAFSMLSARVPEIEALDEFAFLRHDDVMFIRTQPLVGHGFLMLGAPDKVAAWCDDLRQAGAVEANAETYQLLKIEAGLPIAENELTEDYIPLEAGLWHAVSFSKGCYTGQEIIARMESRGKLAKMMVRLQSENPLSVGQDILSEGKKVGTVTSAAPHPESGDYVGLGFVKSAIVHDNAPVTNTDHQPITILGIAGTQPVR